ncbi:hypothetical protein [Aquibaculum sediminis]
MSLTLGYAHSFKGKWRLAGISARVPGGMVESESKEIDHGA